MESICPGEIYDPTLYRELDELPTLAVGQADDLKIDSAKLSTVLLVDHGGDVNVWVDRTRSGVVTVERRVAGRYEPGDENDVRCAVDAARRDGLLPS